MSTAQFVSGWFNMNSMNLVYRHNLDILGRAQNVKFHCVHY